MFRSNTNTVCTGCGAPITVGDPITWSRKSSGVFHPNCHPSRVRTIMVDAETGLPVAAPAPITNAPVAPVVAAPVQSNSEIMPEKYELPGYRALKDNSPWWDVLAQCTRVLDRILLVGPPSSGKSTTAMLTLGIKHRITMTQNTSREDVCGMFHLVSGQTVWLDGPITKAMRNGAPILLDEIDRCGPEVESLMYSVIDDHPHLTLPNGELVLAAPGFKVLMTSNVPPDVLEEAVRDRMQAIIFAYAPHEDALSGMSGAEANVVRNYYKTITVPRLAMNPTVRRMRAFKALCTAKMKADIAARVVFGQVAAPELLSIIANLTAEAK